jgi:hypothetical protein
MPELNVPKNCLRTVFENWGSKRFSTFHIQALLAHCKIINGNIDPEQRKAARQHPASARPRKTRGGLGLAFRHRESLFQFGLDRVLDCGSSKEFRQARRSKRNSDEADDVCTIYRWRKLVLVGGGLLLGWHEQGGRSWPWSAEYGPMSIIFPQLCWPWSLLPG